MDTNEKNEKNILSIVFMVIFSTTSAYAQIDPKLIEYQQACKKNDSEGCYRLGKIYDEMGMYLSYYKDVDKIPKDNFKAAEYYENACNLGRGKGCILYSLGNISAIEDYVKAFEYNKKGCSLNYTPSCTSVGISYYDGTGARQDYSKANEMYFLGCKNGDSLGCYFIGMAYKKGEGVKKNYLKAKKLFGMSSDMQYEEGCQEYAILNK